MVHRPRVECGRITKPSARALRAIGVAYAPDHGGRLAAMGDLSKPLEDPYLAVMEVLILVMAPILVLLAVVIHACAAEGTKLAV
jgi:hypothetical protein